jgi:hypothetical protein
MHGMFNGSKIDRDRWCNTTSSIRSVDSPIKDNVVSGMRVMPEHTLFWRIKGKRLEGSDQLVVAKV